jgi:hypothetical protein
MIKVLSRAFTGNYLVPVLVVIAVLFASQSWGFMVYPAPAVN